MPPRFGPVREDGGPTRVSLNRIRADIQPVVTEIPYRRDVDGLRAVAVLAVVAYHAFPSALPGGFVGVDIFFVISGYLITAILAREIEGGDDSLMRFYERRARRLLPALSVVLAASTIAALILLPPFDLDRYGRSLATVAGFVSNIGFWLKSGYFDQAARTQPLLHTWSLGVEEQFYLVWPLVLAAAMRFRRRLALLAAVGLASLVLAEIQVRHWPDAAFYLLPARIFEFVLGALVALRPAVPIGRTAVPLAWLGLALILLPIGLYSRETPFPGLAALVPCLGAALVILAGPGGAVARLLGRAPLVAIGLLSYSLYLWHWPVLIFGEIWLGRPLGGAETGLALALVLGLSALTWRFVERPFRRRITGPAGTGRNLAVAGAVLAAFLAIGIVSDVTRGLAFRAGPELRAKEEALHEMPFREPGCVSEGAARNPAGCASGTGPLEVVLWGDSHAEQLTPGLARRLSSVSFLEAKTDGCPPLAGAELIFRNMADEACRRANDAILAMIEATPGIETVVLAARWSLYAETVRAPTESADRSFLVDEVSSERSVGNSRRVLEAGLERTISALEARGVDVVLVGQVPEYPFDPARCAVRAWWTGHRPDCGQSLGAAEGRLAAAQAILGRVAARHASIAYFDPVPHLCEAGECRTLSASGMGLYRDQDHLSIRGAELLAPLLPLRPGLGVSRTSECEGC